MRGLAVVTLLAFLLGCQQSPTPGPAPLGSLTVQLKQEGDALAARGDYAAAVVKYQAALNQEPDDVSLRFALGTALSHLDRREETVEQFRFMVSRGSPESPEVQAARRWLIAAGELVEDVTFAPPPSAETGTVPPAAPSPSAPQPHLGGAVKVRVTTAPRAGTRELRIVFFDPGRILAFDATVKPGESFEFPGVQPGTYKVTVEDPESGTPISEQQVTVQPGKDLVLDLK